MKQIDNRTPAVKRPDRLINGRRYRVLISVRAKGESAAIEVWLGDSSKTRRAIWNRKDGVPADITRDGSPLVHWAGKQASLETRPCWRLPNPKRPGLGQHNTTVTFPSARFRLITGKASWIGGDTRERKPATPDADADADAAVGTRSAGKLSAEEAKRSSRSLRSGTASQ